MGKLKDYSNLNLPKALINDKFHHLDEDKNVWVEKKDVIVDVQIWYISKSKIRFKYEDELGTHRGDTAEYKMIE